MYLVIMSYICGICLENCSDVSKNGMIWWCEHVFHKCCINKLLEYDRRCPMCRNNIKNVVDMSDKMDVYIYKCAKLDDDVVVSELGENVSINSVEYIVNNYMEGYFEMGVQMEGQRAFCES